MSVDVLAPVAFPRLDQAQLDSLASCPLTKVRRFREGEPLVKAGDRNFNFYIVKSGRIEVLDESGDTPSSVTIHEAGAFTGEVGQLTGSPSLVTIVGCGEGEVYELPPDAVQLILNHHPDLGDLILTAFLARRQLLHESGFTGFRVIGPRHSSATFRVLDFLSKNNVPHTCLDPQSDATAHKLLLQFHVADSELPVIAWGHKLLLRNPSNRELAEFCGLRTPLGEAPFDLVVVGGGPAGLAAAVYGASEGLRTVILERTSPGGQAGRSMRIENYLGFPGSIRGEELAQRAMVQAIKFHARLNVATQALSLSFDNGHAVLRIDSDEPIKARALLIATGADYRLLGVDGCQRFEGSGVYYAATPVEAQTCRGSDVVVVGGGNSAGQAVVYLANEARKVYLLICAGDIRKDMSSYLVDRIQGTTNVEVLLNTEVRCLTGDDSLNEVEVVSKKTGEVRTLRVKALFSFIGAVPRTDWLPAEIEKDDKQFIRTGAAVSGSPHWSAPRQPFYLETSHPGVFAAGDVRSGSVKCVASAVGEGAMAVQFVHEYFKAG